jgi:hypothetical protein
VRIHAACSLAGGKFDDKKARPSQKRDSTANNISSSAVSFLIIKCTHLFTVLIDLPFIIGLGLHSTENKINVYKNSFAIIGISLKRSSGKKRALINFTKITFLC